MSVPYDSRTSTKPRIVSVRHAQLSSDARRALLAGRDEPRAARPTGRAEEDARTLRFRAYAAATRDSAVVASIRNNESSGEST
jgi:hypothetical protein